MILERECLGWHDFLIWWFVFPFFENTRTLSKNNPLPINRQTMKIQVSFTCNTAQFWPCKPLTLLFTCTMVFYFGTRNKFPLLWSIHIHCVACTENIIYINKNSNFMSLELNLSSLVFIEIWKKTEYLNFTV